MSAGRRPEGRLDGAIAPPPDYLLRDPPAGRLPQLLRAVARVGLVPSLALSLTGCTQSHHPGRSGGGGDDPFAMGGTAAASASGGLDGSGFGNAGQGGAGGVFGGGGVLGTGGFITPAPTGTGGHWAEGEGGWSVHCDAMGRWAPLEVLLPATDFDHAVAGRYRWRLDPEGNPLVELTELHRYGTPCDAPVGPARDECLAELAGPIPFGECAAGVPGCDGFYLTATRGSEVEHFLDHEGLMRFLGGRVDSPEAALLVVYARGANLGRARDNCGDEIVRPAADGYYVLTYVDPGCFSGFVETLHVAPDGTVELVASHEDASVGAPCEVGRLTAGLAVSEARTSHPASPGAHLDTMAVLEGTAVAAFERLARELHHHGAPAALVRGARRAAAQEVHHTRMVAGLARAHGGCGDARPIRDRLPVRDLESIALENAREGCVRETYGAAVAHYQAGRAADPGVRTAMDRIAHDESEHAELSWRVAAWLDAQLDARARGRVLAGRRAAAASLWRSATDPADASTAAIVGMPSAAAGRRMLGALMRTLWT